jgi:monoamine oxidase
MLREARAAWDRSRATGMPLDEVRALRDARVPTRRQLLAGAAAATGALILPHRSLAIGQPRVAIVGGGIAGLTCANELWRKKQIRAQVYEWDSRVGGRIQTLRSYFANGQTAEQHAEFISSEHSATRGMARRFGLSLESTYADPRGARDTYWFSGARYDQHALDKDWRDFGWKLFNDAALAAPRANYLHSSRTARHWDNMSVVEWIERNVPDGMNGRFGKLCYSDVISEYGGPPESQSALNLIYILGFNDSNKGGYQSPEHPMLAGSDERWHVVGGNDQLISGLLSRLPDGTIQLGRQLTALSENSDGSFTLSFASGGEAVADHVVLAIPFTTLRNVDLSGVTLSPLKQQAIAQLPLGNNVKLQIQVAGRPWTRNGFDGDVLTEAPFDGSWDGTSYQNGGKRAPTEILIVVPGGAEGAGLAAKYGLSGVQGPAPATLINDALAQFEPILPGVTRAWSHGPKLAWVNDGNSDPHLLGAWSQYNIGQYTGFGGIESVREGNIHFAGEHTSYQFQGFIEGAVRTGLKAAREIA